MGLNEDLERLAATYQELLKKELEPYQKGKGEPIDAENFKRYMLKDKDINEVCTKYNIDCNKLKSYLIEIEYDNNGVKEKGYHTSHFDLIYRIVNIRNLIFQPPLPLEYRIEVDEESVPDFGRWELGKDILKNPNINLDIKLEDIDLIEKALGKNGSRVSTFQRDVILEILKASSNTRNQTKGIGIIAPTASGKTLSFLIPVLTKALERVKKHEEGVSALLIYPRKALERDQLKRILEIIDKLNEMINKNSRRNGNEIYITIGIDDGDTPRKNKVKDGKPFRGLKCIKDGCNGDLIYSVDKNGKVAVKCTKCGKVYNYILATKEDIWINKPTILISNIYTVYRRLMYKDTVKMYSNLDYVVLDEAHVYTDYFGGHVYYILQMLKYVARKSNPIFIFSSATIPNPKEFIEALFGQQVEIKQFGKDDKNENKESDSSKNNEMQYKRLVIRLYLLPNPLRSIETLYEAIASAVTLWAHKYNQKVITFIDSIAEIATLGDYIKSVILGARQGQEIMDHVNIKDPLNDYSWVTIAPSNTNADFLTREFKNSTGTHHGRLKLEKRAKIEAAFQEGKIRHLMSTSTLELGIDISDVAIVIQYKLPITPEGVIQRIGRAGRDTNSFRIALGIILLPSSPIGTLYMYNEKIRKRFADISVNRHYGVGYNSDIIKLQALLSSVLLKRALEDKETYIAETSKWNIDKISLAIQEILNELKDDNLDNFISQLGVLDRNELRYKKAQLQQLLQNIIQRINSYVTNSNSSTSINNTIRINLDNILQILDSHIKKISKVLWDLSEFEKKITAMNFNLNSPKVKFIYYNNNKTQKTNQFDFLKYTLNEAYELLKSLKEEIINAGASSSKLNIDRWIKQKEIKLNDLKKNLSQINILRDNLMEIVNEVYNKTKSHTITRSLYSTLVEIVEGQLRQTIDFLSNLSNTSPNLATIINSLKNVDVNAYYIDKSIQRLNKALKKRDKPKFSIFDIINELSNNKMKFSLMLQPPFPEIEEEEIEKVELNE